jgi:Icc-related predicted phosphoesterase
MKTIVRGVLTFVATAFLAVGDFGVGGASQRNTGEAMRKYAARNGVSALVTLGDNDYTRNAARFALEWQASFGWVAAAGVTVSGTLGNHDVELARGRYQFRILNMPAPYYVRRIGDVELIVLDSTAVTSAQTAWLRRILSRRRFGWRVAVFHHPPYTCGGHLGSATIRRVWGPLLRRGDVRLVLSGHDHNYQRFAPVRGVTYLVNGGGGAGLYRLRRCPAAYPRRVAVYRRHGFLHVATTSDSIVVRAVGRDGSARDRVTIP